MKCYCYIVSTHVLLGDAYVICDEAGRGQDSEGGCEKGCENWKQSKIGSDDRFGNVWV